MIDRRIVKFKLRRGTDDERKYVIFEEGELVYTTDTKKVYVGDGRLSGGELLSNGTYFLSGFPAVVTPNDLLYRGDFGKLYIADPSGSFIFTGPYPDETSITFSSNKLGVKSSSITPTHLSYTIANANSGIGFNLSGLHVLYDPSTLAINSGRLTVIPNGSVSFTLTPGGGLDNDGTGLHVNVDGTTLGITSQINGNYVYVKEISATQIASRSVNYSKLSADVVAPLSGLKASVSGLAVDYDPITLFLTGGKIAVNPAPFTSQHGLSGYQKLQGGFTIQWGVLSGITLNETFNHVNFPAAFTACYNVQATISYNNFITGSMTPVVKNVTTTSMSVGVELGYNTSSTTGNIYWTAIGYIL